MIEQSRLFYKIFLGIIVSSISGIIYFSLTILIFSGSGNTIFWLNYLIAVTGFIIAFIQIQKKINFIFKLLVSIILPQVIIFAAKYVSINLSGGSFQTIADKYLAVLAFIIAAVQIFIAEDLSIQFNSIYNLMKKENIFTSDDEISHHLAVKVGDSPKIVEIKRITGVLFNYSIFLLSLSFITILKNPSSKLVVSIYFIFFFISGTGIYLIIYQLISYIKWRMNGLLIKQNLLANWNRMIFILIGIIAIIPIIIPWNFTIINLKYLSERIGKLFSGMNIPLENENLLPAIINNPPSIVQNISLPWIHNIFIYFYYILLILACFCSIYLILGIIGWILFKIFYYKKKNPVIQFFINRYFRLKWLFDFCNEFYINLRELILMILLNKKDKKERKKSKLEKHFLSFFGSYKKISEEKMEEIQLIIREFIRFIEAASRKIQPYYYYYGPKEYLDLIIIKIPELEKNLNDMGTIFNESRYSKHLLNQEKKEYFRTEVDYSIHFIDKILYQPKNK